MSIPDSQFDGTAQRKEKLGFWRAPIRFIFGYDIFISYARNDADKYAELLETRLEAAGFATFRDKREIWTVSGVAFGRRLLVSSCLRRLAQNTATVCTGRCNCAHERLDCLLDRSV